MTKEKESGADVITRIFENRVRLLQKPLDAHQKNLISEKIIASVDDLDDDSFIVRERLPAIKRIKQNAFVLEKYVDELLKEIAPLMILNLGTNPTVSAFILQTEKLFGYILDRELEKIERIKEYVQEMAKNILHGLLALWVGR